jgi:hypothetical protein
MDEVLECEHINREGRHVDNDLSAEAHQFEKDRIKQDREIIPNSLILVHCDLIIDSRMRVYLEGTTIPKPSRVVAIIDGSQYSDPEDKLDMIPRAIETASSKEDIIEVAEDYFRTICPECSGYAARAYVHRWKEGVFNRVEN